MAHYSMKHSHDYLTGRAHIIPNIYNHTNWNGKNLIRLIII